MEHSGAILACPVLTDDEVARRVTLLAELQAAPADLGVQSVLARRHKIVLRAEDSWRASSQTDPQLHVFGDNATDVVTTDGAAYQFASGRTGPVGDPRATAASVLVAQP
jgi:hypothetical protein